MNTPRFAAVGLAALTACALSLLTPLKATHTGWQFVRPSHPFSLMPPPRDYGASVIGDGFSMLMFGGRTNGGVSFNDVWVLSNAAERGGYAVYWNERIAFGTPPPPRYNAGLAYDWNYDRLIVFGGCEGACLPASNDVWVLYNAFGRGPDPAVWKKLATSGTPPAPRHSMLAAFGGGDQLIIYGGHDGSGSFNGVYTDVWTLSNANGFPGPSTWQQRATSGVPHPGGYAPTGVYDGAADQLIIAGGYDSAQQKTNAVHVLSPVAGAGASVWTNTIPEGAAGSPPPFAFAGGAFDGAHGRLLMTLPNAAADSQDVWSLRNGSWTQYAIPYGPSPSIATALGVVYDPVGTLTAYFAGPIPFTPTFAAPLNREPAFTGSTPAEGTTITVRQGQRFTATIEAGDPDEWDSVWIDPLTTLPAYATLSNALPANPASRVIDWDTSNFYGSVEFTFQATDSNFGKDTRSFTVNVTPDTSPHFVSPPSPSSQITVTTGMPVSFTVEAGDADPGDVANLTLDGTNLPASAVFTGGGTSPYHVSWTPSAGDSGFYGAIFKVTDQAGMALLWPVSIYVAPNNPPVFCCGTAVTAVAGQPLRLFINAQDHDPFPFDHLTTITVDPATMPPGATGATVSPPAYWASFEFNWTPGPDAKGHHIVHFVASDQYGASSDLYLDINVVDPDLVSISVAPTSATRHIGEGQTFQAVGTFSDGSTKVLLSGPLDPAQPTVQWTSTNQAVATIDATGNVTTLATGQTTIIATSAAISCLASGSCATLQVTNTAPTAQIAGGPFTLTEGNALSLAAIVNDADGDTVSVTWSVVSGPGQLSSPNTLTTGFTHGDGPAETTVRLTAADSHGLTTFTETTIRTNNRDPQVSIASSGNVVEGSPFSTGGSFSDAVADTWNATVNYGDGTGNQPLSFSGIGETKSFTLAHVYAQPGTYTIVVTVTDDDGGVGQAQTPVTVTPLPQASPDGLMHGAGHVDDGSVKHHFTFRASQSGGVDAARLEYWVTQRGGGSRFEATQIASVAFAGTGDSVVIAGAGTWNGAPGYSFEARASERGEPGRNHDVFSITVTDASGRVVSTINDTLDGGNIQASRLRP